MDAVVGLWVSRDDGPGVRGLSRIEGLTFYTPLRCHLWSSLMMGHLTIK